MSPAAVTSATTDEQVAGCRRWGAAAAPGRCGPSGALSSALVLGTPLAEADHVVGSNAPTRSASGFVEDTDVGEGAIAFGVVESVPDRPDVRDVESQVVFEYPTG